MRIKTPGGGPPSPVIPRVTKALTRYFILLLSISGPALNVTSSAKADSTEQGCTLRIHVDHLRNANGVAGVLLFTSPAGWPEDVTKSFRHEASPITHVREATVIFHDIPPNNYGVVVLHDENKNMKLDRNLFGWPKEGFGFANNPHVGLGPAAFPAAVLRVACPATEAEIHIIYK